MDVVLVQALSGLASASSLFLVASGLTVIFGVTRVVNFAHGSLFMLGAYVAWIILSHLPRDPAWFVLGVVLTGVALAAIGAAIEMTLLRRIYKAPELLQLLATFGVVLVVQDLTLKLFGPDDLTLSRPRWLRSFVDIADQRVPFYDLVMIGIGPLGAGGTVVAVHAHPLGHAGARGDPGPGDGGRAGRGSASAVHSGVRAGGRAGWDRWRSGAARWVGEFADGPDGDHRRVRRRGGRRPGAA